MVVVFALPENARPPEDPIGLVRGEGLPGVEDGGQRGSACILPAILCCAARSAAILAAFPVVPARSRRYALGPAGRRSHASRTATRAAVRHGAAIQPDLRAHAEFPVSSIVLFRLARSRIRVDQLKSSALPLPCGFGG